MARHMSETSAPMMNDSDRHQGDGRRPPTREASERRADRADRADNDRRDQPPPPREPRYSDGDLLHGR